MQRKRTCSDFERRLRQALSRQGYQLVRRARTRPGWNLLVTRWNTLPMLIWPRATGRLDQAGRADLYARSKLLSAASGSNTIPLVARTTIAGQLAFSQVKMDIGVDAETPGQFYLWPFTIPARTSR